MIISGWTISSIATTTGDASGPFRRLTTVLTPGPTGAELIALTAAGDAAGVEWIWPFSWDAGRRGVQVRTRALGVGDRMVLHAGPYATADAVAGSLGREMRFPAGGDGHRYSGQDEPAPDDDHQDSAGWVLIDLGGRCLVVAWDFSGTVTTEITRDDAGVRLRAVLPLCIAERGERTDDRPGPDVWLAAVEGGLDDGAAALRRLIVDRFVTEPDLSGMPGAPAFPTVVANSWGVGEDTSTERILAMMAATAEVGAEVFVVDKGWERAVGDWHANDRFPSGMAYLSARAREAGMGFGVWCGFGNADPNSPVAREHPDWLASWRGTTRKLSFDTYGLCLGHDPARDWIADELRRMVTTFELTWLIHDFETMSRCDRPDHTHGPGGGDQAAEEAWHQVLGILWSEFPQLVLEHCWNGGRPLDLGMVRSHHTTITEDHCLVHWNCLAKVAMGRYLPLDWQSAYMGAEALPPRARIAPYVIGGPWIMMDDPTTWDEGTRAAMARAVTVYKAWREDPRHAVPGCPTVDREGADAVQASTADGRAILAVSLPPGPAEVVLSPVGLLGTYTMTDEWAGLPREVTLDGAGLRLPVDPHGDGLLLSFRPVGPHR